MNDRPCHYCSADVGEDSLSCRRCGLWFCASCLAEQRDAQCASGESATTCCPGCGATLLVEVH